MSYFEDMPIGEKMDLGERLFTKEEIMEFARKYDPAPECLRGLEASRWQVVGAWMRRMMESRAENLALRPPAKNDERPAILGPSPGFLEMRWPNPVRAGDRVRYRTTIAEKILLKSRPQWGLIRNRNEAFNERGECVLSFLGQALFERRNPGGGGGGGG